MHENMLPGYVYSLLLFQLSLKGEKVPFVFWIFGSIFQLCRNKRHSTCLSFFNEANALKIFSACNLQRTSSESEYIHRPGGFLLFISAALSQNVGICEELLPLRGAPCWGFFFFFLFHDFASCGHRNRSHEMRLQRCRHVIYLLHI